MLQRSCPGRLAYNPLMLLKFHAELLRQALSEEISPEALRAITAANLAQDSLRNQVGHDELHFDNNAFPQGRRYIEDQRARIVPALLQGQVSPAWQAFGRLSHTAQDFYAHSNYISLWVAAHAAGAPASEVDPLEASLLESPALHSGKLYYPGELLYFIPPLRKFALARLPADSHARMNLDSPAQGPLFEFAFAAALKRTRLEFGQVRLLLPPGLFVLFSGRQAPPSPARYG